MADIFFRHNRFAETHSYLQLSYQITDRLLAVGNNYSRLYFHTHHHRNGEVGRALRAESRVFGSRARQTYVDKTSGERFRFQTQAKGDVPRMDVSYAEILFPPICKINDVSMQLHYVHVQLIYVNMHHNYVYIQLNYVNIRDRYMYVKMQPKLCCFF